MNGIVHKLHFFTRSWTGIYDRSWTLQKTVFHEQFPVHERLGLIGTYSWSYRYQNPFMNTTFGVTYERSWKNFPLLKKRSWTWLKRAFMNTQKIALGQHLLSKVPVRSVAFMNGVWTGIHEHPKNTTWPTPNFPGPYKVKNVHEPGMNGFSWTPKK